MTEISTILHRRTDLSTFVVHLTRESEGRSPLDNLVSVFNADVLEARTAYGWTKGFDVPTDVTQQSQRVVCFSETPLEHIHLLTGPISLWGTERSYRLAPYGIALTKVTARGLGINPVWYVDMTVGRDWVVSDALDSLRRGAADTGDFHNQPVAKLLPFIEQMGRWDVKGSIKEWWWEREWRHIGNLQLPASGIIWLCPEAEIAAFRAATVGDGSLTWIDPTWGLERIIAHLAGFEDHDVSPFANPPAAGADEIE